MSEVKRLFRIMGSCHDLEAMSPDKYEVALAVAHMIAEKYLCDQEIAPTTIIDLVKDIVEILP